MALSPVYAAILQDLNKAVAHGQPEDVLQFCANWFNAKLEEQRIAGRLSIAQAEGAMGSLHTGARSKSLAPIPSPNAFPPQMQHHQQQQPSSHHPALKKKASLPSLAGQGYTFGSGAAAAINGNGKPAYYDAVHPSPFSETPPSRGGGPHSNNNGYHHPSASSSSRNAGGAVPSGSPSTGGIMWNRPFPAMHGGSAPRGAGGDAAGGPTDIDMQHEDEEDAAARLSEGRDRLGAISPGNRNGGSGGLPPSSSSASASAADNGIPQGYNLGRRTSVSAESIDPNSLSNSAHSIPKVIIPKTPSQRARIESSTEKNLLFRNLDEEQHNDVVNAMKEVQVTQGTEVIVQGAVGDFFYVVESGDFQIWVKPQSSSGMVLSPTLPSSSNNNNARGRSVSVEPEGSMKEDMQATTTLEDGSTVRADGSKLVATITSGGSFGELALMYNAPRAATVVCSSENATLWALDRVTFRTILMEHTSKKRRMYEQFLSEVPILVSLEGYERSKIADALEERIYEEGEDVVREGELGKNFYIIESGKAEVLKRKEGGKQERVGTLTKGDYFGELALLNSAPRAATVRAVSGRLRVATLGEKAFTRLLGPVVEILTRSAVTKYGASSVASGESSRGGNVNSSSSSKDNNSHSRHERERSGTSTPTTAAGREREKE